MRYALLADIHANLAAFQAVLDDIKSRGEINQIWCLGDVVGYGPDPVQCIRLLRQQPHVCVAGNHDWAATGLLDISDFNPRAAEAVRWTSQRLGKEETNFLRTLPVRLEVESFTLVHGSPRHPVWEYLVTHEAAMENLPHFQTKHCLVGHSHQPLAIQCDERDCHPARFSEDDVLDLSQTGEHRLYINPGGVGQPRDGDPRASYAIFDTQDRTVRLYRVEYDVRATQEKMLEMGLPDTLASRLKYGY